MSQQNGIEFSMVLYIKHFIAYFKSFHNSEDK